MLNTLFAHVTVAAAAEGGEDAPEGIDLLIPNWNEAIAGIIAFAIIGFVVWRFVLPSVNEILEKRQQAIAGQLGEAEQAKAQAESLLADYKSQLADARSEGERIIEDARNTAESMKADILAKANAEAEELRRKAAADAAAERLRASAELRSQVVGLSLDVAEKVVAGGIDRGGQLALVDRYIDELGGIGN